MELKCSFPPTQFFFLGPIHEAKSNEKLNYLMGVNVKFLTNALLKYVPPSPDDV